MQPFARLRASGQGRLADLLSAVDFVPGQGIDFGKIGHVLLIVLTIYLLASLARAARLVVGPPVVEEHDVVQHHPADAHPAPVAVVQRGVHLRDVAVHVRRAHADLRQQRLEPVDVERACAERDRLSGGGRGARGESRHGRDRQGEEQAELHC